MLFDPDKYLAAIEDSRSIKPLHPPNNKVAPVNLPKLAIDKRLASIVVNLLLTPSLQIDVRIHENFSLRDRFDWDLSD